MKIPVTGQGPATVETHEPKVIGRCDSCGAQAYVSALVTGTELLFCAHHFTQWEVAVRVAATTVVDERWRLTQK